MHVQIYCQFFFPPFNMKSHDQVFLFHTSYMHNPWNWIQLEDLCLFLCVHVCRVLRFWIWEIQSDGGYEFCAPSPIARTLCMWRGLGGGVVLSPRNTTVCLHSVQQNTMYAVPNNSWPIHLVTAVAVTVHMPTTSQMQKLYIGMYIEDHVGWLLVPIDR